MKNYLRLILSALTILLVGTAPLQAAPLRLATTTSTQNSGLLDLLLPAFQQHSGIKVHVIAVGTGKALKMGRDGDVDVVMVHATVAEEQFVRAGHGIDRLQFMYNDFIIVGPKSDPAKIQQQDSIASMLKLIQKSGTRFISRGDDSGTHKRELKLWQNANLRPSGEWYMEAGQGMGRVLQMAGELEAYTLTDRGTWLAQKGKNGLAILGSSDEQLNNPYGIIAINPDKYADINYSAAKQLIDWLGSQPAQQLIKGYRLGGEPLFVPLLLKQ